MKISAFGFYKFKRAFQIFVIFPLVLISILEFVFFYSVEEENKLLYIPIILFFVLYGLLRLINGLITILTKQYFATKTRFKITELKKYLDKNEKDKNLFFEIRGKKALIFAVLDIFIGLICFGGLSIVLNHIF